MSKTTSNDERDSRRSGLMNFVLPGGATILSLYFFCCIPADDWWSSPIGRNGILEMAKSTQKEKKLTEIRFPKLIHIRPGDIHLIVL